MNHFRFFLFLVIGCFAACRNQPHDSSEFSRIVDEINNNRKTENREYNLSKIDSAFGRIRKPDNFDRYQWYDYKTWYYSDKGHSDSALMYSDSMILVLEGVKGLETDYAHAIITKGFFQMDLHQYSDAVNSMYQAKLFTEKYLDTCSSLELYSSFGKILYQQEKYKEAIQYFKQALFSGILCNDQDYRKAFIEVQGGLNAIGLCFEKIGEVDSAIVYYKMALQFIEENKYKYSQTVKFAERAKGVVYGNLGGALTNLNKFEEAEGYLLESIRINSREGFEQKDAAYTFLKLGKLYLRQQKYKEVKKILDKVSEFVDDLSSRELILRSKKLEWELNEAQHLTKEAYHSYLDYIAIKTSIDSVNREFPGLTQSFFHLSQKDQLRALTEKDRMRTVFFWVALISFFTLIVIIYLIRKSLTDSKKHVAKLDSLNAEIFNQNLQLKATLEALEASHEENKRVMGTVAHDLRNPVGGMTNLAALLLSQDDTNPEQKKSLEMIYTLGNDSITFMNDLLQFRNAPQEIVLLEVELLGLIRYCVDVMQLKASEKMQEIIITGSPVKVNLNREKIWRVISNLLSNAIKFSPKDTTIEVDLREEADAVLISVRDNGIGIPDHLRDKVFNMLSEAKRMGTEGEKTFGLGLAISKQIVEAHHGRLWFESVPFRGSTFYIRLPK